MILLRTHSTYKKLNVMLKTTAASTTTTEAQKDMWEMKKKTIFSR